MQIPKLLFKVLTVTLSWGLEFVPANLTGTKGTE